MATKAVVARIRRINDASGGGLFLESDVSLPSALVTIVTRVPQGVRFERLKAPKVLAANGHKASFGFAEKGVHALSSLDRVGEILVSGPYVAAGSWCRDEESVAIFAPTPDRRRRRIIATHRQPRLRVSEAALRHWSSQGPHRDPRTLLLLQYIEAAAKRSRPAFVPNSNASSAEFEHEEHLLIAQTVSMKSLDVTMIAEGDEILRFADMNALPQCF